MQRFFIEKNWIEERKIFITDKNLIHQLRNVLRIKDNEKIIFLDNNGFEYLCKIIKYEKNSVEAEIVEKKENSNEISNEIYIYQALPKQLSRFEFVLQKGTELGVRGFVPLVTQRCERREIKNRDRLKIIIKEAAEQCGRGILPELFDIVDFQKLLLNKPLGQNIIAYEGENIENSLSNLIKILNLNERINIFIGPE